MSFQSHRPSCLPKFLQGESTTPPPEQEGPPPGFETNVQDKENTKGKLKESEMPSQETGVPQTEKSEAGKGKELETPSEIPESFPKKVGKSASKNNEKLDRDS
jgi:hypothetical protein